MNNFTLALLMEKIPIFAAESMNSLWTGLSADYLFHLLLSRSFAFFLAIAPKSSQKLPNDLSTKVTLSLINFDLLALHHKKIFHTNLDLFCSSRKRQSIISCWLHGQPCNAWIPPNKITCVIEDTISTISSIIRMYQPQLSKIAVGCTLET